MVDWSVPITTAQMYGPWPLADEAVDEILDRSRRPMPATSLYDLAGEVGVGPDSRVLDIGGRDGTHGLELAGRLGCHVVSLDPSEENLVGARSAIAGHPSGHRLTAGAAVIEAIPAVDGGFDAVWCRDVLSHVADLGRAIGECRRVLAAGGPMIVYGTFATDQLEPAEADRLVAGLAVEPARLSIEDFEATANAGGLSIERTVIVGSQWREAWEEDGSGRTSRQLLQAARLIRCEAAMVDELGPDLYKVELANALWGVYQMLGKLQPRAYVLRRT